METKKTNKENLVIKNDNDKLNPNQEITETQFKKIKLKRVIFVSVLGTLTLLAIIGMILIFVLYKK